MIVSLYTQDGGFVQNITTMPWLLWPEGIMWGQRVFFWNPTHQQYREGLLWHAVGDIVQNQIVPAGTPPYGRHG